MMYPGSSGSVWSHPYTHPLFWLPTPMLTPAASSHPHLPPAPHTHSHQGFVFCQEPSVNPAISRQQQLPARNTRAGIYREELGPGKQGPGEVWGREWGREYLRRPRHGMVVTATHILPVALQTHSAPGLPRQPGPELHRALALHSSLLNPRHLRTLLHEHPLCQCHTTTHRVTGLS